MFLDDCWVFLPNVVPINIGLWKNSMFVGQHRVFSPNVVPINIGLWKKQYVLMSTLGFSILYCPHQRWVVKNKINDNVGFFHPTLSPSTLGCEEKSIFNDNVGFLHPMLSPSTLGCEKKVFLMTTLGFSSYVVPVNVGLWKTDVIIIGCKNRIFYTKNVYIL